MKTFLTTLCALCLALSAQAQQAPGYSCEATPEHRQFDFWLGQWVVTDAAGEQTYGHNTISRRDKGCLLFEEWLSSRGGSGSSINYYNPSDRRWHQHWVDSGSSIIHTAGGISGGSMRMEGSIYYLASGKSAPFRGSWTPLEDGRVRQFFEQQDEAGVWQPWFEGFYRKQD
jgi:hypothetical protein